MKASTLSTIYLVGVALLAIAFSTVVYVQDKREAALIEDIKNVTASRDLYATYADDLRRRYVLQRAIERRHPFARQVGETVDAILLCAERYDRDPIEIAAQIGVESSFNPWARDGHGAKMSRGLLQMTQVAAKEIGADWGLMYSPYHNIAAGCAYHQWLVDRYGEDMALVRYNGIGSRAEKYARTVKEHQKHYL